MHNWTFDLAITGVDGSHYRLKTWGSLCCPQQWRLNSRTVAACGFKSPVEAWLTKAGCTWNLPSDKQPISVVIDPDHVLPDDNRSNNSWALPR